MRTHPQSQELNFEKVWQMFQETDKKFQETDKKFQETREQMKETDRKIQETDRLLKDLGKLHGGLSNNIGESVEEFFYTGFERKRRIGKMRFKNIIRNIITVNVEYDLALTNGEYIALIEVKHKFKPGALEKFIQKKIPLLKKEFPKFADCKIIAGIAGLVIPEETRNAALDHGLYIYTQSGENMKMLNRRGFNPRIY